MTRHRNAIVWGAFAAATALAIAGVFAETHPKADAGAVRLVPIGGTVRASVDTAGGPSQPLRLWVESNRTHHTEGLYGPRCVGTYLRVYFRPASPVAGWGSVNVDGWLLTHGYQVAPGLVHGRYADFTFTRDGALADCHEVFSHPQGNVWVSWQQPVKP